VHPKLDIGWVYLCVSLDLVVSADDLTTNKLITRLRIRLITGRGIFVGLNFKGLKRQKTKTTM